MPDTDGYPTEEELEKIKKWKDHKGSFIKLMEFIETVWWMASWGWSTEDDESTLYGKHTIFHLSTGGWSGNEEIIAAMRANIMFWMMCWYSSQVGGHFIFKVKHEWIGEDE